MIMRATIALAALALAAGPAAAATVRVPVTGKSEAEVKREVWRAANRACQEASPVVKPVKVHRACVRGTSEAALAEFRSGTTTTVAVTQGS